MGRQNLNNFIGCLLGGAIGDALGAPVEFLSMDSVFRQYGKRGITDLVLNDQGIALITDDTQMTLFTAEGMLRAVNQGKNPVRSAIVDEVYISYLCWLKSQGIEPVRFPSKLPGNHRLVNNPRLHSERAPGVTCLGALSSGIRGTIEKPVNNSKGCGAVMRAAPAGLVDEYDNFSLGCEIGALTHGNSSAWLSAGFLAELINHIINGFSLYYSINFAIERLKKIEGHEETLHAVTCAVNQWKRGLKLTPGNLRKLGPGWIAPEALSISLFCALSAADDFRTAVTGAVNHSGDSDSTGSITGNIMGALLGTNGIPGEWLGKVEMEDQIILLASSLHANFNKYAVIPVLKN